LKYYTYYPGCSAESTGLGEGISVKAIAKPLEIELIEIENWTCCGSTPYGSIDEEEAVLVAARNLAIAEKAGLDIVTPCSSCYVTLNKANLHLQTHPKLLAKVNQALGVAGLSYHGTLKIRHIVDVLVNDITPEGIGSKVQRRLEGLKVAPYYGCQLVRPNYGLDDTENPQMLDRLVKSTGAEAVPFAMKAKCCGGSHSTSEEGKVIGLMHKILQNAADNGADCLVTPCPLCQTNLDAYQGKVKSKFNASYNLPVLFITQLVGLALGLDAKAVGLETNIVSTKKIIAKLEEVKSGA